LLKDKRLKQSHKDHVNREECLRGTHSYHLDLRLLLSRVVRKNVPIA
jgi:hypothetical protein